jgi:hypothetical protein
LLGTSYSSQRILGAETGRSAEKMRTSVIVDGRNAFDREQCIRTGFIFKGVGLPRSIKP